MALFPGSSACVSRFILVSLGCEEFVVGLWRFYMYVLFTCYIDGEACPGCLERPCEGRERLSTGS